jgi:hypothetical protein
MYNKKEAFDIYCTKYNEIDSKYIVDIDEISSHINEVLSGETIKKSDYSEQIVIIENVLKKCETMSIITYAEYILGALLPLHEKELINEIYTHELIEEVDDCMDWVTVYKTMKKLQKQETEFFIKEDTHSLIIKYLTNAKNMWAISTGLSHYWWLKTSRQSKIKNFE